MTTTLFDDPDMAQRPDPAERRAVRRLVLAHVVRTVRGARDWSVNDAASQASVAPMTWRRMEDGLEVRRRTLTALDGLLEVPFGTTARALDDDLLILDLLQRTTGTDAAGVALDALPEFLDSIAERARSGSVHTRTVTDRVGTTDAARRQVLGQAVERAVSTPLGGLHASIKDSLGLDNLLAGIAAQVKVPAPVVPTTDLTRAAELVDRMTRRAMTPALENAVAAILAAMPDMLTDNLQEAAAAVDVLAESANRTLNQAADEMVRLSTERAIADTARRRAERGEDHDEAPEDLT